ncbi:hypothetical protein Tco_0829772 [Tanacetum coccineum]
MCKLNHRMLFIILSWKRVTKSSTNVSTGTYVQWKSRIKRYIDTKPNMNSTTNVSKIHKQHQNEVNEIRARRLARTANPLALVAQQQPVLTDHKPSYSKTLNFLHQITTIYQKQGKAMLPLQLLIKTKDLLRLPEEMGARENVGTPVVQKSGIQCISARNTASTRECQNHNEVKDGNLSQEKDVIMNRKPTLYVYGTASRGYFQIKFEVIRTQSLMMTQCIRYYKMNDNYNVFAMENEHPEQPESSNDIYLAEHSDTNITINSLDICYDRVQDDQDDTDDLDQERDLLASLIQKLKCEIDDSKNRK